MAAACGGGGVSRCQPAGRAPVVEAAAVRPVAALKLLAGGGSAGLVFSSGGFSSEGFCSGAFYRNMLRKSPQERVYGGFGSLLSEAWAPAWPAAGLSSGVTISTAIASTARGSNGCAPAKKITQTRNSTWPVTETAMPARVSSCDETFPVNASGTTFAGEHSVPAKGCG